MSTVYLNGQFLPLEAAKISPLDRGFMFADGVYEVIPVFQGKVFGLDKHLVRLLAGLEAIRLSSPYEKEHWQSLIQQVIDRNGQGNQSIYLQITRGETPIRNHGFPKEHHPTIFIMSMPVTVPDTGFTLPEEGVVAITMPDIRWLRCDIKSISLLPNILSQQEAIEKGADEAILVRDEMVTECAAANVFMVKNGILVTPPLSHLILGGVTRDMVIALAEENGISVQQRPIMKLELYSADELWITSSTRDIAPVTMLDDKLVGNGQLGKLWSTVAELYLRRKQALFGIH